MNIVFDTTRTDYLKVDEKKCTLSDFDKIMNDVIKDKNIDICEYSISNKYLRAIVKENGYEYHILEKPAGLTNIYCIGADHKKKTLQFNMPYTVMIIKLKYYNGKYYTKGDRIFHTDTPVKKDLSNRLWKWGLSNVYKDNYICWGNDKGPDVDSQTTFNCMDEFFLRIKNNDLLENKDIDWKAMSSDKVYNLSLDKIEKLPYKLNSVIGSNTF